MNKIPRPGAGIVFLPETISEVARSGPSSARDREQQRNASMTILYPPTRLKRDLRISTLDRFVLGGLTLDEALEKNQRIDFGELTIPLRADPGSS